MLAPEHGYQEPEKDYYQSFARPDLYSELLSVSMTNRQKRWYFKVI